MVARLTVVSALGVVAIFLAVCSGFTASDECEPGETMPCESQCGPGIMRCLPDGAWDLCQPDREPDCVPGEYGPCSMGEGVPPGMWFCSDDCREGPCLSVCLPGETFECEAQCGPGQMTCTDDGSWGSCREYLIPACRPGDVERCDDGESHRRCSDACRWGPCDDSPCVPGEEADCGLCASQVCLADGTWGECTADPSARCSPDEVEACEAPCGPGQRLCSDQCAWGECMEIDPVACHPGDRQICPTTLYCGLAFRICNERCEWTDCIETGD